MALFQAVIQRGYHVIYLHFERATLLEDENFTDKTRKQRCELFIRTGSEKLYALFTLDEHNEPVIRKFSRHVLGQYRSPIPGDNEPDRREHRHDWIKAAFVGEIRGALGKPVEPFEWEGYPAISQLTMTTLERFQTLPRERETTAVRLPRRRHH